ncbi:MAG: carbohydrate ABC transporter permease [Anaerolineae bacterium]
MPRGERDEVSTRNGPGEADRHGGPRTHDNGPGVSADVKDVTHPPSTTAVPVSPAPRLRRFHQEERRAGLVFASPFILGFIVFTAGPLIASLYLSFTSYDVLNPPAWVGNQQYLRMLRDPLFIKSLGNTVYYLVLYVPLTIVTALALASLLNTRVRYVSFFRTAFYLPHLTPVVAASVLWLRILSPQNGLLNRFLGLFGIHGPAWTVDPTWVKPALVIMRLWDVGWVMIVYLAALKNVPQQLYEAAYVDGAGARQRFRYITVPMISGVLFFTMVMLTIFSLNIFTEAYVMFPVQGSQSRQAGPQNSALFYVYYLFQQAFTYFNMGYASALAWVLFALTLAVTLVQIRGSRRFVYTEASK